MKALRGPIVFKSKFNQYRVNILRLLCSFRAKIHIVWPDVVRICNYKLPLLSFLGEIYVVQFALAEHLYNYVCCE